MKSSSDWKAKGVGYCLSMHLANIDNIDSILKDLIARILKKYSGCWVKGTYWQAEQEPDKDSFEQGFNEEMETFYKLISGIQTRVIGNILIKTPSDLIPNPVSSSYILTFRKIHEEYEIMMFAFAKDAETVIDDFSELFDILEKEIFKVWELFFIEADESLKNRYYLPTTVFYFILSWNEIITEQYLKHNLNDQTSNFFNFLNEYFCVKGTEPKKIPKSVIDSEYYLFRHPSYYFSQELSEKFLLLPVNQSSNQNTLIRTIDIVSSIEFYFTKFFNLIKAAYEILSEIDEKSRILISSFYKTEITSLKTEETEKELEKFISLSHELYPKYPLCDKLIAELEHLYSDASHLIGNITAPSVYSQASEKPFAEDSQGAIETIGIEFQMRLNEILRNLPRNLGRSYHDLNSIMGLIKSYYDLIQNKNLEEKTKEGLLRELQEKTNDSLTRSNQMTIGDISNQNKNPTTHFISEYKVALKLEENLEGILKIDENQIKISSIEGSLLELMINQLKSDYKDLVDQKKKELVEVGWVFFEDLIESVQDWKIYEVKGNPRGEHEVSVVVSRINNKIRKTLGLDKDSDRNFIQNGKKYNQPGYYRFIIEPLNIEVKQI